MREGLDIEVPGDRRYRFTDLVCDYTGTLSCDGRLLPGVGGRLQAIATTLRITVLTADTFGTAVAQLSGLPVTVRRVSTGQEKASHVRAMGAQGVIGVGNGVNDVPMAQASGLFIAVVGPEGGAGRLIVHADIVVPDVLSALDLVLHPLRIKATLRP